jgi:hypothetical protein
MRQPVVAVGALLLSILGSATARADDWQIRLMPNRDTTSDHIISFIGTSVEVGGGVADFTDRDVTDMAGVAGTWNARAIVGTRSLIGGELGYVGTAQSISALGLHSSSALVGNGLEANLRLNIPVVNGPWLVEPYVFGGVGWTRFDVLHQGTNTSSLRNADDVFDVPIGGGIAAHYGAYVMNLRYAFYPTFDDELLMTPTGSTDTSAGLDHWNLGLALGYEF